MISLKFSAFLIILVFPTSIYLISDFATTIVLFLFSETQEE